MAYLNEKDFNDLLSKANEFVEKDFSNLNVDFHNCELDAPLNRIVYEKKEQVLTNPGLPMSRYKADLLRYTIFCLGHISANPSNPGNVVALRELYTFPKGFEHDDFTERIGGRA